MQFGEYRFTSQLVSDAILPPYKGSTFRGVFGGALKKVVCAIRAEDCSSCLLKERCLYARTFEVTAGGSDVKQRTSTPPHPYVIRPPLSADTSFAAGSSFDFSLLLFGWTNDFLPYFIYAFECVGEMGIGRKVDGKRAQFRLTDVSIDGRSIFDASKRKIRMDFDAPCLTLPPSDEKPVTGSLKLGLLTPLRLKYENTLQAQLPFHLLVRAMLRRVSSVFTCYGTGEPPLDYRGMVARAGEVEVVKSDLNWYDWERWSNRQEKAMLMGGMTGSIVYRGAIGEYLPLLDLCRKLHLGKQTSFGLGMFDYTWEPDQ